jgi:hypothetical protein
LVVGDGGDEAELQASAGVEAAAAATTTTAR